MTFTLDMAFKQGAVMGGMVTAVVLFGGASPIRLSPLRSPGISAHKRHSKS